MEWRRWWICSCSACSSSRPHTGFRCYSIFFRIDWNSRSWPGCSPCVFSSSSRAYFIFFETLWNGETPGKRLLGLRVIKDAGYPVDFRAVVTRNLIRAVDFLPLFYALGFIVQLCGGQYKRLGYFASGTLVVRHGRAEEAQQTHGDAVVFRLLDATALSQISRLQPDGISPGAAFPRTP